MTYNLTHDNIDAATAAKHKLEQRQREEAKERKDAGAKWVTKVNIQSSVEVKVVLWWSFNCAR